MPNAKISELPVLQKLGNTGAAPSASRNWDFAYTWNNGATTFTADFQNITDTASNAASLLIDRQVGGVSKFKVSKAGDITTTGFINITGIVTSNGVNAQGFVIQSGGFAVITPSGSGDSFRLSGSSNSVAVINSTTAQDFNVYRTFTDTSNYQRLKHGWNTSTALVMNEGLGTGADGSVAFNDAALATSATKGFVMIPSCAGAPSGVPADIPTGQIPMVWDSTNLKLYVYTGGAWKSSAVFT